MCQECDRKRAEASERLEKRIREHIAAGNKLVVGSTHCMDMGFELPISQTLSVVVAKRATREDFLMHGLDFEAANKQRAPFYYEMQIPAPARGR